MLFAGGILLLLIYSLLITAGDPGNGERSTDDDRLIGEGTTRAAPATRTAESLPFPTPTRHAKRESREAGTLPLAYRQRFGVTGHAEAAVAAYRAGLPFGSYATWKLQVDPLQPGEEVVFWQMIRLREEGVYTPWEQIDATLLANPGALWIIGNEPDVVVQDNVSPERYAELYHDLYFYIKEKDPTATVAIGGVAQPTPLRRAYLDRVLHAYEQNYGSKMPVDIWNVHAFILREERDSWGVGIPPGMSEELAIPYEIEDHDNVEVLQKHIVDFRDWMAERGYGDRPLLISEYGFIMPLDYGFTPETPATFMRESFDFFRTARSENGYAPDGGRLVQWWFWFILDDPEDEFAGTVLFDQERGALTPLGERFAQYVLSHEP